MFLLKLKAPAPLHLLPPSPLSLPALSPAPPRPRPRSQHCHLDVTLNPHPSEPSVHDLLSPFRGGGEVGEGLCSSAVSTFALWHLGAPSVEAPSQEEDTNTDGHLLQTGAVYIPHGRKQACRANEGLICAWRIAAIGVLSQRCPVIPAHSQWTQD